MQEKMDQLLAMGFADAQVQEAWVACDGQVDRAIDYLLSMGGAHDSSGEQTPTAISTSSSSGSTIRMTHASISQYSLEAGRSACTCIALTAAARLLGRLGGKPSETTTTTAAAADALETWLTPEWIETTLQQGVETYRLLRSNCGDGAVEHMSAEQVLQHVASRKNDNTSPESLPLFHPPTLMDGGVRQGILSQDTHHPLGLQALLEACRAECSYDQWLVVLLTKTPETILLALPPPRTAGNATEAPLFLLWDSHPRPVWDAPHAYVRWHHSFGQLVQAIHTIFPVTTLPKDVPELMAEMYNSFDLYPLVYQ